MGDKPLYKWTPGGGVLFQQDSRMKSHAVDATDSTKTACGRSRARSTTTDHKPWITCEFCQKVLGIAPFSPSA